MAGSEVAIYEILKLAAYLLSIWYAGRIASIIGLSSIPAEIGVGLLFGPTGLDLIHPFSAEFVPLQFLGFIGVSLIIFESGMHLDISRVMNLDIGGNAVIVAILGTTLPIVLGIAFFIALGFNAFPDAIAAGFSLAPTSVGISLSLLTKAKQMQSHYGQIIISAAFLDDIFSIICLVVLVNLASGSFDPVQHTILPLIYAFAFVGFGAAGSVYLMPPVMSTVLQPRSWWRRISDDSRSMGVKDEIHMTMLFCSYVLFSLIGDFIGSSLLGAFVAGMLYSNVPRSHLVWQRQFKRAVSFLLKIFFAATVAFSIQLTTLFTGEAVWMGLVMGAVPCLLSKLICAAHIGSERWIVGVAMMARGEFAYLVAEVAHSNGQLSDLGFAVIVWALLWATIIAPMVFSTVLQQFVLQQFSSGEGFKRAPRIGGGSFSGESTFIVRLTGDHHVGMVREICDALHSQGLDVLQSTTETDGIVATGTFVVTPREALTYKRKMKGQKFGDMSAHEQRRYKIVTDFDDEKLDQIADSLRETMADEHAIVIFEACEKEEEVEKLTVLEVKLFGESNQNIMREITIFLTEECELDVRKAIVDTADEVDYSVFYCSRKMYEEVEEEDEETGGFANNSRDRADSVTNRSDGKSPSISVAREKSSTSVINFSREKSNTSVINISTRRSSGRINAKREKSNASIVLRQPEMLEKTIEIVRKDTNRSAISAARAQGKAVEKKTTHAMREVYSTFTAEQRDFIRDGIRNIYYAHNLSGGAAIVKMIHEEEMVQSVNAADMLNRSVSRNNLADITRMIKEDALTQGNNLEMTPTDKAIATLEDSKKNDF